MKYPIPGKENNEQLPSEYPIARYEPNGNRWEQFSSYAGNRVVTYFTPTNGKVGEIKRGLLCVYHAERLYKACCKHGTEDDVLTFNALPFDHKAQNMECSICGSVEIIKALKQLEKDMNQTKKR